MLDEIHDGRYGRWDILRVDILRMAYMADKMTKPKKTKNMNGRGGRR